MESHTSVKNYNIKTECDSSASNNLNHSDPVTYFGNMDLSYFVYQPLEMYTTHARLRDKCMTHGNPEAHYIEGVIQYFIANNKMKGLHHLREASRLDYQNGTYLYGVLKLALGHWEHGEKYLDKLDWKESLSTSNACWERVKNSLRTIPEIPHQRYSSNMNNFRPRTSCNLDNMTKVCKKCYYYKRLDLFVKFAKSKE